MTADAYATSTIQRLERDARAVAASVRGVLGVEPGDLVSAGWLAYVAAQERGLGHAGCAQRARYAMIDEVRDWIGTPVDHGKGAPSILFVPVEDVLVSQTAPRATRTRLPRRVRSALRRLPARSRSVLTALYLRGWPVHLVAAECGMTSGAVCNAHRRGLQHLSAAVGASSDTWRRTSSFHRVAGLAAGSSSPQRRTISSRSNDV